MWPMTTIDCSSTEGAMPTASTAGRFIREQILKAGLWPKKLPLWA